MALTDTAIKNAKPGAKPAKLADEKGLFLLITQAGGKLWRVKYRFGGKEKLLALGAYPEVSLKEARNKRDEARRLLSDNIDPGEEKKARKAAKAVLLESGFEFVAREWHTKNLHNWKQSNADKLLNLLQNDIFPWLGDRPIGEITAPELLQTIRRIESRGVLETAHRARSLCGQIFRYAVATGRAQRDPASDLRGALPAVKHKHHASITDPKAIGQLLRDIDNYSGTFTVKCAFRLSPLFFVRAGELRQAEWAEIDLDKAEWRIPANKMKMNTVHIVPLATQAVAILHEMYPLTGTGKYVFPSTYTTTRPMSENTIRLALRRLGYTNEDMTPHGFRSMASTLLNEQGFNRDAIERQLAHCERNGVRAAYNYAEYLPERRKMMQQWADYLDKLKAGAEVIPLPKKA